jgi:hypothetical protein
MEIPAFLVSQVREGNAVLFLGAGASREAKTAAGVACPTTKQLINHLSKSFLGGKYTDLPLN